MGGITITVEEVGGITIIVEEVDGIMVGIKDIRINLITEGRAIIIKGRKRTITRIILRIGIIIKEMIGIVETMVGMVEGKIIIEGIVGAMEETLGMIKIMEIKIGVEEVEGIVGEIITVDLHIRIMILMEEEEAGPQRIIIKGIIITRITIRIHIIVVDLLTAIILTKVEEEGTQITKEIIMIRITTKKSIITMEDLIIMVEDLVTIVEILAIIMEGITTPIEAGIQIIKEITMIQIIIKTSMEIQEEEVEEGVEEEVEEVEEEDITTILVALTTTLEALTMVLVETNKRID